MTWHLLLRNFYATLISLQCCCCISQEVTVGHNMPFQLAGRIRAIVLYQSIRNLQRKKVASSDAKLQSVRGSIWLFCYLSITKYAVSFRVSLLPRGQTGMCKLRSKRFYLQVDLYCWPFDLNRRRKWPKARCSILWCVVDVWLYFVSTRDFPYKYALETYKI